MFKKFFERKLQRIKEEELNQQKRIEKINLQKSEIEEKFKINKEVEYLGVKMIVIRHHLYSCFTNDYDVPGIHVEWMDSNFHLQNAFFNYEKSMQAVVKCQ